jgi:hypothetical protein
MTICVVSVALDQVAEVSPKARDTKMIWLGLMVKAAVKSFEAS